MAKKLTGSQLSTLNSQPARTDRSDRTDRAQPLTLEKLDAMPAGHYLSMKEMSMGQLDATYDGMEQVQTRCEETSGICGTVRGLILLEQKSRVPHGEWKAWLGKRFPKSYRSAAVYMSLAKEFSKSAARCTFEQMQLALPDAETPNGYSIDVRHPLIARVAKWTKGRSCRQLIEEALRGGGNHHPECPHCGGDLKSKTQEICPHCGQATGEQEKTQDELLEELRGQIQEWAAGHLSCERFGKRLWQLLPDHEGNALGEFLKARGAEIIEHFKTPKRRREKLTIAELLGSDVTDGNEGSNKL